MRNRKICSIMVFFILAVMYKSVSAGAGVGIYGAWSAGMNNINEPMGILVEKTDVFISYMGYGCGFIADSNLDSEKIFNYRFRLGYDYEVSDSYKSKYLHRVMLSNVFGAGIYRDEILRIWLGPQIGAGYLWGSNTFIDKNWLYMRYFPIYKTKLEYSMINIHLGLVLGININILRHLALSLEGGFRYNLYYELDEYKFYIKKRIEQYFPVMGPEGHIALSIMYRINNELIDDKATGSVSEK